MPYDHLGIQPHKLLYPTMIVMLPNVWDTICIPKTFFTLKKLGPSQYLGSAMSISTYMFSRTFGVKLSAYGISALLNTL